MPLYHTEGDEDLFDDLNQIFQKVEQEKNVKISMHTRVMIFLMISAIKEDPSPYWKVDRVDMRKQIYRIVESLPETFGKFIDEEGLKGRVTLFQALHWLLGNIDSICPFDKILRY